MNAFPNPSGAVFTLTEERVRQGCQAAAESPRKRIVQPVHRTQDASVQRIVNFLQPGTYIRPHVHALPGQVEFLEVLQGRIGFVLFDEQGRVASTHDLSAGPFGLLDIEPGTWHGLICLAPDTIITEAKQGPYDARHDKTFADWAPPEDDSSGAANLVRDLEALFPTPRQTSAMP